jgi:hypothetical protein
MGAAVAALRWVNLIASSRAGFKWFNPRILPDNKYLSELQEETQNSVHKFIESVDCGEYVGSILYQRYRDYCVEEGMSAFSNTKFSTQLLFLMENGSLGRVIERNRTKKSILYIIKDRV